MLNNVHRKLEVTVPNVTEEAARPAEH